MKPKLDNGRERRQHPRADIAAPVRLRLPDLDAVFSGRAVNVSRGGMFIPMASPPPVGTRLLIDLCTCDSPLLQATVEVVRRIDDGRDLGVGVRFVEISFGAQELIDRMVTDESMFGDYQIEALLGQGGMAEVYRARELSCDEAGRLVALKRILPELTRDRHIAHLFHKEAGVARRLRHPHVIQVYDVGEINQTLYLTMELIHGCHLGQLIAVCAARSIRLPIGLVCYLGHCIASGLQYAHGARDGGGKLLGLVHRDVTPSNLFVSRQGDIKLGDFGVAMIREGQGEQTGARVGKDLYAAPEQLVGAPLTAAADVYGLAASLFELLTLHAAFEDDIEKKLTTPPPSARDLRPDVPARVAAALRRAMSPVVAGDHTGLQELRSHFDGVEARYPDASSFADALATGFDARDDHRLTMMGVLDGLFRA